MFEAIDPTKSKGVGAVESQLHFITALSVFAPLIATVAVVTFLGGLILKLFFDLRVAEHAVVVGAYASLGVFFGFCVGASASPLLGSILGFVVPILTMLTGVLFKDRTDVLAKYAPAAFVSVVALLSCMLLSMVYATQLYQ